MNILEGEIIAAVGFLPHLRMVGFIL